MHYDLPATTDNFSCLSNVGKRRDWFPGGEVVPRWKLVTGGEGEFSGWVYIESVERVVVEYGTGSGPLSQPVALSWAPRYLGGAEMEFKCPECHSPRRRLYLVEDVLACRKCAKLYHRSQGDSVATRRARLAMSLAAELGVRAQPYGDPDPPQPEGMNLFTYNQLLLRYRTAQLDALAALAGDMAAHLESREPASLL